MRKLVFVIALFVSISSFGQDYDYSKISQIDSEGNRYYEKIDTAIGSADEIFTKSKEWMINTFVDTKAVLELEDKGNHHIMGKGLFISNTKNLYLYEDKVSFIIDIQTKDNRFKIKFYNISDEWRILPNNLNYGKISFEDVIKHAIDGPHKKLNQKTAVMINDKIVDLIHNYMKFVNKPTKSQEW